MIDSSNAERIAEAHDELAKLMAEKRLKDALLLVYANKQASYSKTANDNRRQMMVAYDSQQNISSQQTQRKGIPWPLGKFKRLEK